MRDLMIDYLVALLDRNTDIAHRKHTSTYTYLEMVIMIKGKLYNPNNDEFLSLYNLIVILCHRQR